MCKRIFQQLGWVIGLFLLSGATYAAGSLFGEDTKSPSQERSRPLVEEEEAGFSIRPFLFYPRASVLLGYDDNMALASDYEMASTFAVLSALGRFELIKNANVDAITLGAEVGQYFDSSVDNYENFQLAAETFGQLTRRMSVKLLGEYLFGHDPRGSTDRDVGGAPDTWHSVSIRGGLSYGRQLARGRIETEAGFISKRYDEYVYTEKLDDTDIFDLKSTFFYKVAPKTRWLLGIGYVDTDYKSDLFNRDNTGYSLDTGVTWQATAQTSGEMRIGYSRREYDDASRGRFSGLTWDALIRWSPLSRSVVDLSIGRQTSDTTGVVGDYILTSTYGVAWSYAWTARFISKVSIDFLERDYANSGLSDDVLRYTLGLSYQFRRWLTIGGRISHAQRDSTESSRNYEQNTYSLTLDAHF